MDSSAGPTGRADRGEHPDSRDTLVRRTVTVLLLTVVFGLLAAVFALGIDILLAVFAGVLVAIFLRALTNLITRVTPVPDGWALVVVLATLLGGIGAAGWLLAPNVVEQAEELAERIPEIVGDIEDYLQERGWGRWILDQTGQGGATGARRVDASPQGPAATEPPEDEGSGSSMIRLPEDAARGVGGWLAWLPTWGTYVLTALFVGLFGAANPSLYTNGVVHLVPIRHRPRTRELLDRIGYTLRWWLIGQLFSMVLIGVSTTIVLWIFDVPFAVVLGLIVGLLGFIPYLGPIIGIVPVALIAATQDLTTLVYVVMAYTGVQLLEGYVANPLIHQGTVHLPPATTVAIQMLMGTVIGIIGIVLATPLAAVLLVVSQFYRSDVLGDPGAETGAQP